MQSGSALLVFLEVYHANHRASAELPELAEGQRLYAAVCLQAEKKTTTNTRHIK